VKSCPRAYDKYLDDETPVSELVAGIRQAYYNIILNDSTLGFNPLHFKVDDLTNKVQLLSNSTYDLQAALKRLTARLAEYNKGRDEAVSIFDINSSDYYAATVSDIHMMSRKMTTLKNYVTAEAMVRETMLAALVNFAVWQYWAELVLFSFVLFLVILVLGFVYEWLGFTPSHIPAVFVYD
jgi:hypothetical protein